MVTVNMSYYSEVAGGNKVDWFKLVSEGGYISECRIKDGDEDKRAVDMFLRFTQPPMVSPVFLNGFDENRRRKLEERISVYNQRAR